VADQPATCSAFFNQDSDRAFQLRRVQTATVRPQPKRETLRRFFKTIDFPWNTDHWSGSLADHLQQGIKGVEDSSWERSFLAKN